MSNVGLQERIRLMQAYKTGDKMRAGCVASQLSSTGKVIKSITAQAALKEMAANGELKQVGESYYRPMPARAWIVRAWRKRSDRQLGIMA